MLMSIYVAGLGQVIEDGSKEFGVLKTRNLEMRVAHHTHTHDPSISYFVDTYSVHILTLIPS